MILQIALITFQVVSATVQTITHPSFAFVDVNDPVVIVVLVLPNCIFWPVFSTTVHPARPTAVPCIAMSVPAAAVAGKVMVSNVTLVLYTPLPTVNDASAGAAVQVNPAPPAGCHVGAATPLDVSTSPGLPAELAKNKMFSRLILLASSKEALA